MKPLPFKDRPFEGRDWAAPAAPTLLKAAFFKGYFLGGDWAASAAPALLKTAPFKGRFLGGGHFKGLFTCLLQAFLKDFEGLAFKGLAL